MEEFKDVVLKANLELPKRNLVIYTWGNASEIDRDSELVVIKPCGLPYEGMKREDLVVINLNGKIAEGKYRPSVDDKTHLVLYKYFPSVSGIVHNHSTWATMWAQAHRPIPCLGTTHGDHFYGEIPCTRELTSEEIEGDYEKETGEVIVETFKEQKIDPDHMSGVLVASHGPFTWGKGPIEAVHNSAVLEEIAKMAWGTPGLAPEVSSISPDLLDRHFFRKHDPNAYFRPQL